MHACFLPSQNTNRSVELHPVDSGDETGDRRDNEVGNALQQLGYGFEKLPHVYVCVCVHVYTRSCGVHFGTHTHFYPYTHVYVHMDVYVRTPLDAHVCVRARARVCVLPRSF